MLYNNKLINILNVIYLLFLAVSPTPQKPPTSRRELGSHRPAVTDDRRRIDNQTCYPCPFPGYLGGCLDH